MKFLALNSKKFVKMKLMMKLLKNNKNCLNGSRKKESQKLGNKLVLSLDKNKNKMTEKNRKVPKIHLKKLTL
jgi:hypothetical protein